jgi:hypothetical protein
MQPLRSICPNFAYCIAAITLTFVPAAASDAPTSGLYDITVETSMPHLEENLRYTIEREQRCLKAEEVLTIFPILRHRSLDGCKLGNELRHDSVSTLTLMCRTGDATRGHASWRLDTRHLAGRLDVKLGGKNMTFYQRATLERVGDCK